MKILVSDVEQGHGDSCKARIETECPTADVVVRLESLAASIIWAENNNVDIISRSTEGLSDSLNEYQGQDAEDNGIGIVHALGSNSHIRDTNPSDLDLISAVSGGSGETIQASYGPGLEYFNPDESAQSYATARTTGIIAQLMIDNPTWSFHDARQALRQTAHLYSTGRIEDGGYGSQDKTAAGNVATLDLSSPIRKSFSSEDNNINVLFSWKNNPQSDFNNTVIAMFDSEPTREQTPTAEQIIYEGTAEEYNYTSDVTGNKWFAFYTRDSSNNYSKIENNADDVSYWFDKVEISLLEETEEDITAPIVSIDNPANGSTVSGAEVISFSGDELHPEVSVDDTNWTSATDGITTLNDIPEFEDIGETGFTLYFRSDDAAGNMGTTNINLTKEVPLGDPVGEGDKIMNFTKGLKKAIKTLSGAYFSIIDSSGTPSENGAALLAEYARVKALELELDVNTRYTIYIPAGQYDLASELTVDTSYIDVVSLNGEKSVHLTSDTINVTADYVNVTGIDVGSQQFKGCDNLANIVITNCEGTDMFSFSGMGGTASGTFKDCVGGVFAFGCMGIASGTFTNCTGDNNSFGRSGTASGTFTDCIGGFSSFGCEGIASGTFTNCTGGDAAFSYMGTASGTFKDCVGGEYAFGCLSTASGTFKDCTGGSNSFGSGVTGPASGTFTNCTGGDDSFGGYGTASGTFTDCTGGYGSFSCNSKGGNGVEGKVFWCQADVTFFVTGSGIVRMSLDSGDNEINLG